MLQLIIMTPVSISQARVKIECPRVKIQEKIFVANLLNKSMPKIWKSCGKTFSIDNHSSEDWAAGNRCWYRSVFLENQTGQNARLSQKVFQNLMTLSQKHLQ